MLLDLGLPDGSGEGVLQRVRRRNPNVPVIILTARAEVDDKVRGLDLGANDYVTKPFAFEELLARVRAATALGQPAHDHRARRRRPPPRPAVEGGVAGGAADRAGARASGPCSSSSCATPPMCLSRTRILSQVWEYSFDPGSNVVDVYVGYLRRKLNRSGLRPLIQTVRGAGYRLLPP